MNGLCPKVRISQAGYGFFTGAEMKELIGVFPLRNLPDWLDEMAERNNLDRNTPLETNNNRVARLQ
jgi:hypothetical protein